MKVKVLTTYSDDMNSKDYVKEEIVSVDENINSDFYRIWIGNHLDLLPKKLCEVVKGK